MRKLLVFPVLIAFAAMLYYSGVFVTGLDTRILGVWKTEQSEELLEFLPKGKLILRLGDKSTEAIYKISGDDKMSVYFKKWENPGGNAVNIRAKINTDGNLELYSKQNILVYKRYNEQLLKQEVDDADNSTKNDKVGSGS